MKWYFASRVRHTEKLVQVSKFLQSQEQEITSTWIYGRSLKPYQDNVEEVQKVGTENSLGILDSDIFVMISDPEGTDMFVELGIALGKNISKNGSIKLYIVGDYSKRSLMQLHPAINHVASLGQVLEQENIKISDFEIPIFN